MNSEVHRRSDSEVYEFSELTLEEYKRVATLREPLWNVFHVEEKFRLLLANYEEFEQEILRRTNHHMIFSETGRRGEGRYEMSRKLVNLLTMSRIYVDQVKHSVGDNESVEFTNVAKCFQEQYDRHLGYRTMETLLNFIQRRGLPVQCIIYGGVSSNSETGDSVKHICNPYLLTKSLYAEGDFDAKVLSELEGIADRRGQVDLKSLVRAYLVGIAAIHRCLREVMCTGTKAAEAAINDVCEHRMKSFQRDGLAGVELAQEDTGKITSAILVLPLVFKPWKDPTKADLDFERHFVTSQIDPNL